MNNKWLILDDALALFFKKRNVPSVKEHLYQCI